MEHWNRAGLTRLFLFHGSKIDFEAAADDLEDLTELTRHMPFFGIPTRTYYTQNSDKPWFTAKLKQLCQVKQDAYSSGDIALYNQAK